jgi:hypothetical protein
MVNTRKINSSSSDDPLYYESIKRELKTRPINECRCDERLETQVEESTRLIYTGLHGEQEHLKIKKRLIDEKFVSMMGECDRDTIGVPSIFKVICTPEVVKKRSISRWTCKNKSRTNSLCNLPDVLAIAGINEVALGWLLL